MTKTLMIRGHCRCGRRPSKLIAALAMLAAVFCVLAAVPAGGDADGASVDAMPDGGHQSGWMPLASDAADGGTTDGSGVVEVSSDVSKDSGYSGRTDIKVLKFTGDVEIGEYAFKGCSSLGTLQFGPGNIAIGENAFYGCTGLVSVTISASVSEISSSAFSGCTGLSGFDVDSGNANYCDADGVLFNKDGTVLVTYPAGKADEKYTVPSGVSKIEQYAFSGCSSLKAVESVSTAIFVDYLGFDGCASLATVVFKGGADVSASAFYGCTGLQTVEFGSGTTAIAENAFNGRSSLKTLQFGSGTTTIAKNAFKGCKGLEIIDLREATAAKIDGDAFAEHSTGLSGKAAFYDTDGTTRLTSDAQLAGSYFKAVDKKGQKFVKASTVTIDCGNGETSRKMCIIGDTIDLPSAPTKEGHAFVSWKVGDDVVSSPYTMPAEDVIFTATWKVLQYGYTVEYQDSEGKTLREPTTGTADYGSTVAATPIEIEGHASPTPGSILIGIDPEKNVAVLVYAINEYTITFSSGTGKEWSQKALFGETIALPGENCDVSKEGCTLAGWSKVGGDGSSVAFELGSAYAVKSDAKFEAVWAEGRSNIVYIVDGSADGSDGTGSGSVVPVDGDQAVIDGSGPEKEGCTFAGWISCSDPKAVIAPGMPMSVTEPLYLRPYYIEDGAQVFKVTLDFGNGTVLSLSVEPGMSVLLPGSDVMKRDGYRFVGWKAVPGASGSGSGEMVNGQTYAITDSDVSLAAVWELRSSGDLDDDPYIPNQVSSVDRSVDSNADLYVLLAAIAATAGSIFAIGFTSRRP